MFILPESRYDREVHLDLSVVKESTLRELALSGYPLLWSGRARLQGEVFRVTDSCGFSARIRNQPRLNKARVFLSGVTPETRELMLQGRINSIMEEGAVSYIAAQKIEPILKGWANESREEIIAALKGGFSPRGYLTLFRKKILGSDQRGLTAREANARAEYFGLSGGKTCPRAAASVEAIESLFHGNEPWFELK